MIVKNNDFISGFIHGVFNNCELPFERDERIQILADDINELLKKKKHMEIPDIVRVLNVNVVDVLSAVKVLKERGSVVETE